MKEYTGLYSFLAINWFDQSFDVAKNPNINIFKCFEVGLICGVLAGSNRAALDQIEFGLKRSHMAVKSIVTLCSGQ